MKIEGSRVLITGGAGFIGSYVAAELGDSCDTLILDNLSSGRKEFVERLVKDHKVKFAKADLLSDSIEQFVKDRDTVIHLASNPDVRAGIKAPSLHFESNVVATHRLLEAMSASDVKTILYSSTSTIYGEPRVVPTPEDYGPLVPISVYGATKLASEALISSYAKMKGWRALIFRLANVVGGRSTHGVTYDLVNKLRKDSTRLEILGAPPGTFKSYVHVKDVVAGMISAWRAKTEQVDFFNIGSEDVISVKELAEIVVKEMGLGSIEYRWTGGVGGGRGWAGDVKKMILSVGKLKKTGWKPKSSSAETIRIAVREMLEGA